MAVLFFPRKTSNHRWNAVLKLKEHARKATNADDETVVAISERDCGDPGSGGVSNHRAHHASKRANRDRWNQQAARADHSDALAPLAARTGLSEASVETEIIAP